MKLVQILSEAKKDDVKKELLNKFPDAETYIDAAIRSDSTGYKYMDYIKKSFEDLYPKLKSWDTADKIFEYFDNITWWEKNYNKISVDDLDSIYEDAKADGSTGTPAPASACAPVLRRRSPPSGSWNGRWRRRQ